MKKKQKSDPSDVEDELPPEYDLRKLLEVGVGGSTRNAIGLVLTWCY